MVPLLRRLDPIIVRAMMFVCFLYVIMLCVRFWTAHEQFVRMHALMAEHAEIYARDFGLHVLLTRPGASADVLGAELAKYVARNQHLLAGEIVGQQGETIAYSQRERAPASLREALAQTIAAGRRDMSSRDIRDGIARWNPYPAATYSEVPVDPSRPETSFRIRMVVDLQNATDSWLALARGGVIGGGFLVLVAFGFIVLILRHPIRSLRESAAFTRELARGSPESLGKRLDGIDALLELRLALNAVADELRRNRAEQVRAQADLLGAKNRAERATEAKSAFLANMSHEIRTPLNGVLGMIDLTLDGDLSTKDRHTLEQARKSGEALLQIVNDVLDFSRIEAGRVNIERVPFSLNTFLEDLCKPLVVSAAEKGLELFVQPAPSLPPIVVGDPFRSRQILTNLIGNAIKFTVKGHVRIMVDAEPITGAPAGGQQVCLRYAVVDTGAGVPEEQREHIFGAFTQADESVTRRFGGSGLGLSISAALAALMGGSLRLARSDATGSCFEFRVNYELPDARAAAFSAPDSAISADARFPACVYWVDPLLERREWCGQTLKRSVSAVITAASVQDAFDLVERQQQTPRTSDVVQMVFLDGTLLDDSARASLTSLVHALPNACFVAVLGPKDAAPEMLQETGAWLTLFKPALPTDILRVIDWRCGDVSDIPPGASPFHDAESARLLQQDLEASSDGALPLAGMRVLVADDSPINQEVIMGALQRLGAESAAVDNGQQAIEAVRTGNYAVVLMDIQMPVLDGIAATAKIRELEQTERRRRTPIVAMTAHALKGDRERFLAAGMDGYVSKPFRRVTVADEILSACQRNVPAQAMRLAKLNTSPETVVPDTHELILRFGRDAKKMATLAMLFEKEYQRIMVPLPTQISTSQHTETRKLLHSLQGIAAMINADQALQIAREMERRYIEFGETNTLDNPESSSRAALDEQMLERFHALELALTPHRKWFLEIVQSNQETVSG
jgi:two-component system, sensor histidine kinase and response regulator